MKKYSLIGINTSYSHTSYSVYHLYAQSLYQDKLARMEFHINQPKEMILQKLYEQKSEAYFFSCYLWNIEIILQLCSDLKKLLPCKIILGGSEVGYAVSEYFDKEFSIDYIVTGSGDKILDQMIDRFERNEDPLLLQNVSSKENQKSISDAIPMDFSTRVFPYNEISIMEIKNKIIYYESTIGCPYSCSYCISQLDRKLSSVPIDRVLQEIQFFIDHEVELVKFIDRTFNWNNERAISIIKYILKNNHQTKFHFEVCAELLSEELIDLLTNAPNDWFQLEIGLQSTYEPTLNAINRHFDSKKFTNRLQQLTKNSNIHIHADLIALLPFETLQSFQADYDYLADLHPHMLQLGFLKLLHGTTIHRDADQFGIQYSSAPPYEALCTNDMTFEDKILLKKIDTLTDRYYNSMSFVNTIKHCISKYNGSCFSFFKEVALYFHERHLFDRMLSKKELYQIMYHFLITKSDYQAINLLAFDFLRFFQMRLPDYFIEHVTPFGHKMIFDFLSEADNITRYLSDFSNMKPKELFKKITIATFSFDPIKHFEREIVMLFVDEKDETVFHGNRFCEITPNVSK